MDQKRFAAMGMLVPSAVTTVLLLSLFFKNPNAMTRLTLIPFLVCGLASLIKSLLLLCNRPRYVALCNRVFAGGFLLFWFGVLFVWCVTAFRDNTPLLSLLSLPFWFVGFYLAKRYLLPRKAGEGTARKKTGRRARLRINPKVAISCFLVGVILIAGVSLLFFGIRDTWRLRTATRGYAVTQGYFMDYRIYSQDEDGTTYQLIYAYQVDGVEYTVHTDYGAGQIPAENSQREVRYDPSNPSKAVLSGANGKNMMLFFGLFFTLGALAFILAALSIKGCFDRFRIDVMGAYIGFVLLAVGAGLLLFQSGTASSFWEGIRPMGLWVLIPILFLGIGVYLLMRSLFFVRQGGKTPQ